VVVGRGLRPVREVAARIAGVGDGDLSERIRLDHAPSEVQPVIARINELLERLEAAFTRERAFSADVAHELRTPLAGVQTALDVCATQLRSPEAYQLVIAQCRASMRRMSAMVDNLLTLARAESGQLSINREIVDLGAFLADCWAPFGARAAERQLTVEWNLADDLTISTDREKLRLVIYNLLDNAVTHVNAGGHLIISAGSDGSGEPVLVEVRNTGCPMPPADAERVFERFWRGDQARRDSGGHCGLGLSLCKRIVTLLDGRIVATISEEGIFGIKLWLNRR